MSKKYIVTPDDVETLTLPWGVFQWLNAPNVTETTKMATGVGTIAPGQGHCSHNHPGLEEILYFMEGEAEQTVTHPDGTIEVKTVRPGDLVSLPADVYHSTMNKGNATVRFLAVYEFSGPEQGMRADPLCIITPAKNKA
jgi:oxalate decarboxylase/phosphoglucose isomerase-like protein (cupin superfamily)